jgi:ribosomal protein S18 acetylase RimI-like enzyme
MTFRLAVADDLRPLHTTCHADKLLSQFRDHFEKMMAWQRNGRCYWLIVCDEADQIVGSGQLVIYPHGSELANLFVVADRRGEGIGTALIDVLTAVARHRNLTSLEIGVSVNNDGALRLYQRLGFTIDRQIDLPCQPSSLILHKDL